METLDRVADRLSVTGMAVGEAVGLGDVEDAVALKERDFRSNFLARGVV
jgi:hypothetical protein